MINTDQYPVEHHLTPTQAHTFSRSGGWWSAIVKSENSNGYEKIRFYLWHDEDGKDWQIVHKWNIQQGRWEQEKAVVNKLIGDPPTDSTPYFPVQHYHVVGGETISKNENWWTAVVQYKKNRSWSTHDSRLYMWNLEDEEPTGTGYKWNLDRDSWDQQARIADAFLDA